MKKKFIMVLLTMVTLITAGTHAAFILEIDTDGQDDGVITYNPNFSLGADMTYVKQSVTSNAYGTTGGDSIFGGDSLVFPHTYIYTYTPASDADNLPLSAGLDLGSGNLASGLAGGDAGTYRVYGTWPYSTNIGGPVKFTISTAGADDVVVQIDQNYTGYEWILIAEIVSSDPESPIIVTQESTTTSYVSMRAYGLLFERISETEPIVFNPSFEYLNGELVPAKIMGVTPDYWTFDSGCDNDGIESPSSDGDVCVCLGGTDSIYQLLDYTISEGDEFTLRFDSYYIWSASSWNCTFQGRLYYDDNGQRVVIDYVEDNLSVADLIWHLDYQVSTTIPVGSNAVGKQLGVELAALQADDSWFAFDNVRLIPTILPLPEPSLQEAVAYLESTITQKEAVLEEVQSSLVKEALAKEVLEDILEFGNLGDLTEQDIAKAIKKLEVSIAEQERVVGDLEDSIARLTETIELLGYEPFMAAHWTLDDGSGDVALDSSGHGHDGTLVNMNTNTCWVTNDEHNALEFDGVDDYVEVAGYKGITGGSSRTTTAWVNVNTAGSGSRDFLTWGSNQGEIGGMWLFRINPGGCPTLGVYGGTMISSVFVADGEWHHVAAVLVDDGSPMLSEILLYVDGVLDENPEHHYQEDIDIFTEDDLNVVIGARLEIAYYYGLLDDVRIYDKALSSEEIAELAGL